MGTRALVGALFLGFGIVACGGPGVVEEPGSQSRPAPGFEPIGSVESAGHVGANEAHESPQFELGWPQRVDAPCCYQRGLDLRAVVVVKEDVAALLRVLEGETPWESLQVWFSWWAIEEGHFWLDELDRHAQFLGFRRSGPSFADVDAWHDWIENRGWQSSVVYLRDEVSIRGLSEERLNWASAMLRMAEIPFRSGAGAWSECLVPRSRREEAEAWLAWDGLDTSTSTRIELASGWQLHPERGALLTRGRVVRVLVETQEGLAGLEESTDLLLDAERLEFWVAPEIELDSGSSREDPDWVLRLGESTEFGLDSCADLLLANSDASYGLLASRATLKPIAEIPYAHEWLADALLEIQGLPHPPGQWRKERFHVSDLHRELTRHLFESCERLAVLYLDGNSEYEALPEGEFSEWSPVEGVLCCYRRGRDLRAIVRFEEEVPGLLGLLEGGGAWESLQLGYWFDRREEIEPWLLGLVDEVEERGYLASPGEAGEIGGSGFWGYGRPSVTFLNAGVRLAPLSRVDWPRTAGLLSMAEIPFRFALGDEVEVWVPRSRHPEAVAWLGDATSGLRLESLASGWRIERAEIRLLRKGPRLRALARSVSDLFTLLGHVESVVSIETLDVWVANSLNADIEQDWGLLNGFETGMARQGISDWEHNRGFPAGIEDTYPVIQYMRGSAEAANMAFAHDSNFFALLDLHGIPNVYEMSQSAYAHVAESDWRAARLLLRDPWSHP